LGFVFTSIVAIVAAFILFFVIEAFFIWVGAKLAAIEDASFGKAFISAIAIFIIVPIVSAVVAMVLPSVAALGAVVAVLLTLWILKSVFSTGWVRAFVAWILSIVGMIVTAVIVGAAFATITLI